MTSRLTVGDFVSLQRGTTYKGTLVGKPGPALLGLGAIVPGGGFRIADFKTYGGDCPDKLMLFPGDLFVSLKGATKQGDMIGSIARVPGSIKSGRLTQDTVKLVFKNEDRDFAAYLYWLLRTPQYREYCAGRATGSAVVALSREDFLNFPVPPADSSRIHLAHLCDQLEEKIDTLREIKAILDSIARAMFKSWFVDFGPVRAKSEGREPEGMDAGTAALFPGKFQESSIGSIPKGWGDSNLGELMTMQGGTQPPASQFLDKPHDGYIRLLQIRDYLNDDHLTFIPRTKNLRIVTVDDVLIGRYGSGSGDRKKDSLGRFLRGLEGAINVAIVKVIPKKLIYREWIATFVESGLFYDAVVGGSARAVQAGFRQEDLAHIRIAIPPDALFEVFDSIAGEFWTRRKLAGDTAETLRSLRDTLLSCLISGKLRVQDIDNLIEAIR
jgi:type I restriction enzyme S subunit